MRRRLPITFVFAVALFCAAGGLFVRMAYSKDSAQEDLILGAAEGDVQAVRRALATGADPNRTTPSFRNTALYMAVFNDEREVARILVSAGASPQLPGENGSALSVVRSKEMARILSNHPSGGSGHN